MKKTTMSANIPEEGTCYCALCSNLSQICKNIPAIDNMPKKQNPKMFSFFGKSPKTDKWVVYAQVKAVEIKQIKSQPTYTKNVILH